MFIFLKIPFFVSLILTSAFIIEESILISAG